MYHDRSAFILDEYKLALRKCSHYINVDKISGDYLEFGVFNGFSLKTMNDLVNEFELSQIRLFGFDSFEGFPITNESPIIKVDNIIMAGELKSDYNYVKGLFNNIERVKLIRGYFIDSLTMNVIKEHRIEKAAIINIDCDLYDSTLQALTFSENLIQQGTLLILDDWFLFKGDPTKGEQGAFNEWSKNNNFKWTEFLRYGVHGKILQCVGI